MATVIATVGRSLGRNGPLTCGSWSAPLARDPVVIDEKACPPPTKQCTVETVATTMAISIRERTRELAVLRALGFPANSLLALLTVESLLISLVGASSGCLAAWAICRAVAGYALGGLLRVNLKTGLPAALAALGVAVLTSLASTLIPAYYASRMRVAEAPRYVG